MTDQHRATSNAIVHFDIAGTDEHALHSFYSDLLGWQVQPKGPGYALVHTAGELAGAIVEAERPTVTLGVAVADLEQALARATGLGGTVIMPATDNGWVTKAQVADPAGNILTLIQA